VRARPSTFLQNNDIKVNIRQKKYIYFTTSLFAVSAMAMVLSCSEKGPFNYPSQRDLEDMAAMSSSSEGGSSSSLSNCGNYNESDEFCRNNHVYEKCGDENGKGKHEYDPETQFCYNNYTLGKCGGQEYDPTSERCNLGVVERRCGSSWYIPQTQFCSNSAVYDKCEGVSAYIPGVEECCGTGKYALASQFCSANTVYDRCGGTVTFIPGTEACCGSGKYTLATHYCRTTDNTTHSCDNQPYNPSVQFCSANAIYDKCGGNSYEPSTHFCLDGIVTSLCGDLLYTSSQFCSASTVYNKCGGTVSFTPGTEACCGSGKYTLATHYCRTTDNTTHSCDNQPYNPATQFCYSYSKIVDYCGARTEIFDPDLYECKPGINVNGIYLKTPMDYEGQSYNAVLIGTQTWMAENLNYDVEGSKCYVNSESNCTIYGRLYDWTTAMNLASDCNYSNDCSVQTKHRGICPFGWHLPSDAEWAILTNYVGSSTAGTKLKTASGWNTGSSYIAGTDDYGFSALPGGFGNSAGSFYSVGYYGSWWSATEYDSYDAYDRSMGYSQEGAHGTAGGGYKSSLFSVRCVRD